MNTAGKQICSPLILVGNVLTAMGCSGLILALSGLIEAEFFALGISSGIRVIGSVAIAGCLLSAIGYGALEFIEK
jgi:phosphate/sulfate permease